MSNYSLISTTTHRIKWRTTEKQSANFVKIRTHNFEGCIHLKHMLNKPHIKVKGRIHFCNPIKQKEYPLAYPKIFRYIAT